MLQQLMSFGAVVHKIHAFVDHTCVLATGEFVLAMLTPLCSTHGNSDYITPMQSNPDLRGLVLLPCDILLLKRVWALGLPVKASIHAH